MALGLILMPHFPLIHVLLFYYNHRKSLTLFLVHLVVTYGLTAVALTSFMVVLVRDPGPVDGVKAQVIEDERVGGRDGSVAASPIRTSTQPFYLASRARHGSAQVSYTFCSRSRTMAARF